MNRVFVSAAMVLAVVVGVILNMQQVLSADQAVVSKNIGAECGIFAGPVESSAGGVGQITMEFENADKIVLRCKGTDLENLTGSAQTSEGFECAVISPVTGQVFQTFDSHATVSASGVGTMICTYHKE